MCVPYVVVCRLKRGCKMQLMPTFGISLYLFHDCLTVSLWQCDIQSAQGGSLKAADLPQQAITLPLTVKQLSRHKNRENKKKQEERNFLLQTLFNINGNRRNRRHRRRNRRQNGSFPTIKILIITRTIKAAAEKTDK